MTNNNDSWLARLIIYIHIIIDYNRFSKKFPFTAITSFNQIITIMFSKTICRWSSFITIECKFSNRIPWNGNFHTIMNDSLIKFFLDRFGILNYIMSNKFDVALMAYWSILKSVRSQRHSSLFFSCGDMNGASCYLQ